MIFVNTLINKHQYKVSFGISLSGWELVPNGPIKVKSWVITSAASMQWHCYS